MRDRLIRYVLALYPVAWRRRYGREFGALLEDERLGARALLDVTSHCLRQRFSPDLPNLPMQRPDGSRFPAARFRFPRVLVLLMSVAFGGVVIAIRIVSKVAGDTSGQALTTLGSVLLFMLLTMCAAAAIIQRTLRRFK